MKKYLSFLLCLLLTLGLVWVPAVQAAPAPEEEAVQSAEPTAKPEVKTEIFDTLEPPQCRSAVLMDAQSGQVLYEDLAPGAELHSYPASITKVMTALLVLEAVDRGELGLEQTITASDTFGYDLEAGGTTQDIKPGEELSVLDLLYCMLLPSANESSNILAEAVAGSIPAFVERMNERAAQLGMEDTNFVNAHGLHNAGHYTTAYDLALLVRQALQNETFVTIVSSRSHEVPETNLSPKRRITSTNALINPLYNGAYTYTKAIGVKTGSTSAAGKCLASAAQRGKDTLICIVLGAEEVKDDKGVLTRHQFSESKRLLQWGFDHFERKALLSGNPVAEIPVELSADTTAVALKPAEIPEVMLPTDMEPSKFQQDITLYRETVEAPVEAGQALGELTVRNGDTTYATVKLVAGASAKRSAFLAWIQGIRNFFSQTWVKVGLVALGLMLLLLIIRFGVLGGRSKSRYNGRGRGGYRGRRR